MKISNIVALVSDNFHRTVYVDGFALISRPFIGAKATSTDSEIFSLSRGYATSDANMADFRFFDRMLSKQELDAMRSSYLTIRAGCGDGFRSFTEQCDDGNSINLDGCSSSCEW